MCVEKNIKLVEINKEKLNVLNNLMSLYLHDLSEFADDLKVDAEGKFQYEGIELYFKEEELHPYFIYYNDEIAGFVLVNSGKYVGKDADFCVHELFVLKGFRGKGTASLAIKQILQIYKGKYKVVQLADNKLAIDFWKHFYIKENIDYKEKIAVEDGCNCYVQIFEN